MGEGGANPARKPQEIGEGGAISSFNELTGSCANPHTFHRSTRPIGNSELYLYTVRLGAEGAMARVGVLGTDARNTLTITARPLAILGIY